MADQTIDFDRFRQDEALLVGVIRRRFDVREHDGRYAIVGEGDSISIFRTRTGWHWRRWAYDQQGSVFDFVMEYEGAASLEEAARLLDALPPPPALPPRPARPASKPPIWLRMGSLYLHRLLHNPAKYAAWRAYKPLSPATVDRWQLGLGVLPGVRCRHERLIYPVIEKGANGKPWIVGLRGRAITCACPGKGPCSARHGAACPHCAKWANSKGSTAALWNVDGLRDPVDHVVIAENPVDAMLWMQRHPDDAPDAARLAVAPSNGVALWREEWTERCAAASRLLEARRGVRRVHEVWFDNDAPGNPNAEAVRAWCARHPGQEPPEPNGPRVVRKLLAAGCRVVAHAWPAGTPYAHDLGAVLQEEIRL